MKTITWAGYAKTKKGRVIYDRKKHAFGWERVASICWAISNDNIDIVKRDRYYPRMLAGIRIYNYAMLRMYPEFAKSYLLSFARGGTGETNKNDEFAKQWRETTFDIINLGLEALGQISGLPEGYRNGAIAVANLIGQKYWDFLDSLAR